ncbi:MAG: hypothetical protein WCF44_10510 [Candidatus Methylophosphatis roskildensis]
MARVLPMIWGFPAATIGLLLVVAGQVRDPRGARLCGAALLAFALWDFSATSWRSPGGDPAIRFDLLLLLPIALAAAIGGIVSLIARPLPVGEPADQESDEANEEPPDT